MTKKPVYSWAKAGLLVAWVLVSFAIAQLIVMVAFDLYALTGQSLALNEALAQTLTAAVLYLLTLVVAVGVPLAAKRGVTSRSQLGLAGLPTWRDLGLGPAGYIVYLFASLILITLLQAVIPGFDVSQTQDVGFTGLSQQYEYLLAFLTLVVVAPIAEEIVFRGYLYGKIRTKIPMWTAMLFTSMLFGLIHLQWNVGIDVFVMSLAACALREVTGTIWAGILLHMIKNGVAFYFIFINTSAFLVQ